MDKISSKTRKPKELQVPEKADVSEHNLVQSSTRTKSVSFSEELEATLRIQRWAVHGYIPKWSFEDEFSTESSAMNVSQLRNISMTSERAIPSQWVELIRKFSEEHKEECKTVSLDIPQMLRSAKQFPTGSRYEGTWDVLGMSGYGVYTFPHGVVYEGEFSDGQFHGSGELRYPSGIVIRGRWNRGVVVNRKLIFADGLEYSEQDWDYCKMPDRRFTVEYDNGLQPAGMAYLTAEQPTRPIPDGYYDTGDGFYEPKTGVVYKYNDLTAILRSPSTREQKWITENCRTSPDTSIGPQPNLYKEWQEPQLELHDRKGHAKQSISRSRCSSDFEDYFASGNVIPHRSTIYDERGRRVPRFTLSE